MGKWLHSKAENPQKVQNEGRDQINSIQKVSIFNFKNSQQVQSDSESDYTPNDDFLRKESTTSVIPSLSFEFETYSVFSLHLN